jgi:O-antigen/teichoic acid export membrane protein
MKKFAINITANFAGSIWTAIMNIAFIPVYIHLLGIEAYGLIGIYATLLAIFGLLDIGLGTTLNREMARLSVLPDKAVEMRHLVRTLEILYWSVALLVGLVIYFLAPVLAHHWLQATKLPAATIQQAIRLMGLTIAVQWPFTLYSGGLLGLQRQVLLNGIAVIMVTLRFAGVIPILWYVSATIQTYFLWQGVIGLFQTFVTAACLWRSLPNSDRRATFRLDMLRHIWRFAAGISGIIFFAVILTQMDKIILSRLLTLEMFGYYTLASTVAMGLYRFIGPVFNAAYPQFTQLVSTGDLDALTHFYHRSCQIMAVFILPPALTIAFFSSEILLLWTNNPDTVKYAHLVLSLLIIGTALNGLVHLPYAMQLAYGWTQLTFYVNVIALIILGPSLIVATFHYGTVGAACIWPVLNVGYILIYLQLMHSRILPTEKWKWYIQDTGYPLIASFSIIILGRIMFPDDRSKLFNILFFILISFLSIIVSGLCAPEIRKSLFKSTMVHKMSILIKKQFRCNEIKMF